MLAQVYFPISMSGEELDQHLAQGWFRMGQSIFVTNFLHFKENFYSAIWLRLKLSECDNDRNEGKLLKLNSRFAVEIQKASIDQEKETLFKRYRAAVSFEPSTSIQALLYGRSTLDIYDTLEVTVRDNGKLIGCGYFDRGKTSTAGISSFYDPDYRKYSLGKFLIYQKIAYSRNAGYDYFYPGYFVPGYKPFDYKLKIHPAAQEYFELATSQWYRVREFLQSQSPIEVMRRKLDELHRCLKATGTASSVLHYEFYDANLVPDLSHMELFDFPVFLHYFDIFQDAINSLVVYDVRDRQFHWVIVKSIWKSDHQSESPDSYAAHLLQVEGEVIATDDASEMADVLVHAIQSKVFNQKLG